MVRCQRYVTDLTDFHCFFFIEGEKGSTGEKGTGGEKGQKGMPGTCDNQVMQVNRNRRSIYPVKVSRGPCE